MRKTTDKNDCATPVLNSEFTHQVISESTGNIPRRGEKGAVLCKIFNPTLKQFIFAIRLCEGEQPVDGLYAFGAYGTELAAIRAANRRKLVFVAVESHADDNSNEDCKALLPKDVAMMKGVDIGVVRKAIKDRELPSFCLRSDRCIREEDARKWNP